MTAAVQEPAALERLLGTVGEAMTRARPEQGSYDSRWPACWSGT